MKHLIYTLLFIFMASSAYAYDRVDSATPADALPDNNNVGDEWILDFSDEFNDTSVDITKWNIDDGDKSRAARPGLGIDYWMWKKSNVWEEDGNLVLQVVKHNANTMHCGSIHSHTKYHTQYGYFEARIKIAKADKGTHTAFWLQGPNMSNVDGTANDGAEIDIFESAWLGDYTKSVVHIDGYGNDHQANTKKYDTPGIHEGYHTFGLHWTKDFMKIYYDGELKVTYSDDKWVVRSDEFLWLSDGASFGYSGDHFTKLATGVLTAAYVDYIRVWKAEGPASSIVSNGDFEENPEDNKWFKSRSDISLYESLKPFYQASYCKMPDADNERGITQSVAVEPGQPYEFQMTGRIQNSDEKLSDENNHPTKGPATLKAELKVSGETILEISTQSNKDVTVSKQIMIPEDVDKVLVKVSKNWNFAYIDNVFLNRISALPINETNANTTQLHCFPNPCLSNQKLTITSNKPMANCQVIALNGSIYYKRTNINAEQHQIPSGILNQGINLIKISTISGNTMTQKVLIND